jgi:hypothetical protein
MKKYLLISLLSLTCIGACSADRQAAVEAPEPPASVIAPPAVNDIASFRVLHQSNNALRLSATWTTSLSSGGVVQYREPHEPVWRETPLSEFSETEHSAVVAGLRASTEYVLRAAAGDSYGPEARTATAALPPDFPRTSLASSDGDVQGITVGLMPISVNKLVAIDAAGRVVWLHGDSEGKKPVSFARDAAGQLVYTTSTALKTVDYAGNEKTLIDLAAEHEEPHHELWATDEGTYLYLVRESVIGDGIWWCSDRIVERDGAGRLVWTWSLADHADEVGGFIRRYPGQNAFDPVCGIDWSHANSVQIATDRQGNKGVLLSVRNMDRVLYISYDTGAILWQLGRNLWFTYMGGAMPDELHWFHAQHSARMLSDGSVLLFDNGNDRYAEEDLNFSRVVIYRLNTVERTAEITWEYDFTLFATYAGNVTELPSGNILVTFPVDARGPEPYTHAMFLELNRSGDLVWQADLIFAFSDPGNLLTGGVRISSIYEMQGGAEASAGKLRAARGARQ